MASTPYEVLFEGKAKHAVQNTTLQDIVEANFVIVQSTCFGCTMSDVSKFFEQKQSPSSNSHQFQGYRNAEGFFSPVAKNHQNKIEDSHIHIMSTQFSPPQNSYHERSI